MSATMVKEVVKSKFDHGEPNNFSLFKKYISMHLEEVAEEGSAKNIVTENGTQTGLASKGQLDTKWRAKTLTSTRKPTHKRKIKLMDWKRFHRLRDIYDFIDELERDYPAICTVSVIGKSVEGRDIKMLKVSNSNATNCSVWLDASIHPREWISTAVVTYIADVLVKNFRKLSTSITNKDWHIVPILNPDGYEYTHTCDRMWRKNKAKHEGVCVGVDLNRNFSYAWGQSEGSSEEPTNVFYRGPEPFSEPETVAVRDTILNSTTPFKVFLSFHSYFELIIFPWGHNPEPCPHYLKLLEGATIMSRVIICTRFTIAQDTFTRWEIQKT
ncbi:carboxypeptidase B-like isoform X2 [Hyposmocoma kahamanoa]|uniref:carboxypeptidase B-like isoform X2 n=1 Tax=Hyposmocoma kahamanoa TaxID=1477025 RepID=UPI000E6D5B44|nr:carboxypeptidase B-like isoform X2 [Hyposmocoma kahamanoa]